MKFPLNPRPFASVEPSPAQKAQLKRVVDQLLEQTIQEYEHFVHVQNRQIDVRKWKHAKTRENMSVFKAMADMSNQSESRLPYEATPLTGGVPMIGVGSIVGNLADLMYLATTLTDNDMLIQSSYDEDECVDGQLLCTLEHGTTEDPFRRHTLKWRVKQAPGVASAVVRCRDMVFLDCIGQVQLSNGEKVGYVLYRTVEIPECHEINGMVRADGKACYLLRPQGPNSMEVFMRSQVDARGNSMSAVTAVSAANALIAIWKMPWGGQNKKLAWMLRQTKRSMNVERMTMNQCPVCLKTVSGMRTTAPCQLCHTEVCSRCLTVRKISHIRRNGALIQKPTTFCKRCLTDASRLDSTNIIRIGCIPKSEKTESLTNTADFAELSEESSRGSSPLTGSVIDSSERNVSQLLTAKWKTVPLHVETSEEWEYQQRHPESRGRFASDSSDVRSQQEPLWMQMNQLCLAAEETYQLTKRNENAMQNLRL